MKKRCPSDSFVVKGTFLQTHRFCGMLSNLYLYQSIFNLFFVFCSCFGFICKGYELSCAEAQ